MARPKEFETDKALGAAIKVFGEHGFAGTSAGMLTDAMGIGRQSLYDTFGDKWQFYCLAVQSYSESETSAHIAALGEGDRAIDGIRAMIARVVATARRPCLGSSSVSEFGSKQKDLADVRAPSAQRLQRALTDSIVAAQAEGDVAGDVAPPELAAFLIAQIAAIRLAARGGATHAALASLAQCALRALG
ncbi:MAG: TetR/AcrR family transcriptional regulator [Afipia sp.]